MAARNVVVSKPQLMNFARHLLIMENTIFRSDPGSIPGVANQFFCESF